LFRAGGPGSLQGRDAATALVQAINNQAIDDIYTKLLFLVEVPEIKIAPVSDHQTGDTFNISGTTNLEAGDDILMQVVSSAFQPTGKTQNGEFYGTSGMIKVLPGAGDVNVWSFMVDTATFRPDSYIVEVSSVSPEVQASTLFNVTGAGPLPFIRAAPGHKVTKTNTTAGNTTQEEEIAESLPNETPATPAGSNDSVGKGSSVNIGIRPSALHNASVTVSPTSQAAVQTNETVVMISITTASEMTSTPAARTTAKSGIGGMVAVVGCGAMGLIIIRSRRE